MDHDEPLDTALGVMDVERVVREDDGRLLLLFSWGGTTGTSGAGESGAGESVTGDGPA